MQKDILIFCLKIKANQEGEATWVIWQTLF